MVSLNPIRIMKHQADEEKAEVNVPEKTSYRKKPVVGIRDILVRIRIHGSTPLTDGSGANSGSDSFLQ
jgi:hypothetical protein